MNQTNCQIKSLYQKNSQAVLESILVLLMLFFVVLILPQILYRFVYTNPNMTQEPMAMQFLPVVALAIGLLQVMLTLIGNFNRSKQISQFEKQVETQKKPQLEIDDQEIRELEAIIEHKLADSSKTKTKKSTAKTKKK